MRVMNGYLSGNAIANTLERHAASFREEGYSDSISEQDMVARLTDAIRELRVMSMADINVIAAQVVMADALENDPFNSNTWHKIQAIKDVRARTGSGLREAKIAVEGAYPTVARDIALKALNNLATQNAVVGYGSRKRIDVRPHTDSFDYLWDAANASPAF